MHVQCKHDCIHMYMCNVPCANTMLSGRGAVVDDFIFPLPLSDHQEGIPWNGITAIRRGLTLVITGCLRLKRDDGKEIIKIHVVVVVQHYVHCIQFTCKQYYSTISTFTCIIQTILCSIINLFTVHVHSVCTFTLSP